MVIGGYGRVVVTGASGWVGRNVVDLLIGELGEVFADRVVLSTSRARSLPTTAGSIAMLSTLDLVGLAPGPRTLIIHCGFPTQDQVDVMGAPVYVDSITRLRLAMESVIESLGTIDMVYISSGAATSVERGVDVAQRTQVYGQAKLDDEAAYAEATARTGGRLCLVRAFALSGPYMTKPEAYALGGMIMQTEATGRIEVRATRPVRRSYMAIDDMLRIAIHAVGELESGDSVTFETAGEIVEMGELAARVLGVLGADPSAVVRPAIDPDASADDYLGDPAVVRALAARAGITPAPLDEQIALTANWLRAEGIA